MRSSQSISKSVAVLLVLSSNFAELSYVTFEWAYALGKEKDLIPVKCGRVPDPSEAGEHSATGFFGCGLVTLETPH